MAKIWADERTEGILLVDADNAFPSISHNVALHDIQYTWIIHLLQNPLYLNTFYNKWSLIKKNFELRASVLIFDLNT